MPELSAAPSIDDTRTQALLTLIARLAALDLTPLLVYRIDTAPAGALPFLAWQFDILSPLWQLTAPAAVSIDALTDIDSLTDIDTLSGPITAPVDPAAQQRSLIKLAIALHRSRGTPGSIKQALASLGWTDVAILEGQDTWGGVSYLANQGWAVYRVLISLAVGQGVQEDAIEPVTAAIEMFAPERSWLDSVWFTTAATSDALTIPTDGLTLGGIAEYQIDSAPETGTDSVTVAIIEPILSDSYGPIAPIYNSHYVHSGITYGAGEPMVADPALILSGNPVIYGG